MIIGMTIVEAAPEDENFWVANTQLDRMLGFLVFSSWSLWFQALYVMGLMIYGAVAKGIFLGTFILSCVL